jgi:hypothetical protein
MTHIQKFRSIKKPVVGTVQFHIGVEQPLQGSYLS